MSKKGHNTAEAEEENIDLQPETEETEAVQPEEATTEPPRHRKRTRCRNWARNWPR